MTIYFIRHGEAEASWEKTLDPGLSSLGHEQAKALVPIMKPRLDNSTPFHSSPLLRARQTAVPLCSQHDTPVQVNDAFRELPSPENINNRKTWLHDIMIRNWADQDEFLQKWRHNLLTTTNNLEETCVVFTHFMVINTVVGHATGSDMTVNCYPANTAIVTFERANGTLELKDLGKQLQTIVN